MSNQPSLYKKAVLAVSAALALGLGGATLHNQYGADAQGAQVPTTPGAGPGRRARFQRGACPH